MAAPHEELPANPEEFMDGDDERFCAAASAAEAPLDLPADRPSDDAVSFCFPRGAGVPLAEIWLAMQPLPSVPAVRLPRRIVPRYMLPDPRILPGRLRSDMARLRGACGAAASSSG